MNPAAVIPDYGAPAALKPTRLLTPEQIAFYHEHGYLSIDSLMPAADVAEVRKIYDRLFNEDSQRADGDLYDLTGAREAGKKISIPQILNPAKYAPELLATQMVANLKAMMKQLHGAETKMVGDHAINKPPHNEAPTPWHQDEAYWDPAKEYSSLSVWIPLQPATKQNGCMYFVPGSHKLEIVPHRPIGDNPLTPGLEVEPGAFDFSSAVACELPPGGATSAQQGLDVWCEHAMGRETNSPARVVGGGGSSSVGLGASIATARLPLARCGGPSPVSLRLSTG